MLVSSWPLPAVLGWRSTQQAAMYIPELLRQSIHYSCWRSHWNSKCFKTKYFLREKRKNYQNERSDLKIWGNCKTMPEAQQIWGLRSALPKKLLQVISEVLTQILNKLHLQNLNQALAFWLNLNFKILTKPSFRISTKIKLHNLHQASTAKYWPKFSFKILPEL